VGLEETVVLTLWPVEREREERERGCHGYMGSQWWTIRSALAGPAR
jgi:hypothetical protein